MKNYYVLKVTTGMEYEVADNLKKLVKLNKVEDFVTDIIVPEETVLKMQRGKKKEVKRKCYPGYVIVEMDLSDEPADENYWKKIVKIVLSVPNAVSFVGVKRVDKPIPMKKADVETFLFNIGEKKEVKKNVSIVDFEVNENILIIDGAFKNFEGLIKSIDVEKEKVIVEIDIFGRKTPVELLFSQIEKKS
ncbi:MAG: transcription termination/antitermination protein NusG [Spirochaetes bacterium]|nr:transcription termination/antitermination protein NusG [Spirochaetota bacterium]